MGVLVAVDLIHLSERHQRPHHAHEIYRTPRLCTCAVSSEIDAFEATQHSSRPANRASSHYYSHQPSPNHRRAPNATGTVRRLGRNRDLRVAAGAGPQGPPPKRSISRSGLNP